MLKRAFIISFICLSVILFLFSINLCIITKKDLQNFNKCQEKGLEIKSNSAYQERKNIKKDLYITDKQARKHYVISADLSQIFINKRNQSYELIENLDTLTLLCFEKFDKISNLHNIKYITAKKGYYFFPSHNLELKDVDLSFINTNNLQNIDLSNAYFSGKAKELNLRVQKKKPVIEASSFNGLFYPKIGIKCEK